MSLIVDLDENKLFLQRHSFTQDFRDVHAKCWVLFTWPEEIDFAEGFTFRYLGYEWDAVSYKRVKREDGVFISAYGFPSMVCSFIDKKYDNLSSLASNVGFPLAKGYTDFRFEFPIHNVLLSHLLFKYRYASFEQHNDHPEQAWFLFVSDRGLIGCTYQELAAKSVLNYDVDVSNFMGGSFSFARDYLMVRYNFDFVPSRVRYENWIGSMITDKFDIKGTVPGLMGFRYELKGAYESLFKKYDKLVLVRQKYDSTKQPLPWTLTFGQLKI